MSFAFVSDDRTYDSDHALLAMRLIVENIQCTFPESLIEHITIISDGTISHFKNRFQLEEMKKSSQGKTWIFSATGHGKKACDGIGGLLKHSATNYNLSKKPMECIKDANTFVERMKTYTPKVAVLLLEGEKLEKFQKLNEKEWKNVKTLEGIRETHVWKKDKSDRTHDVSTARICEPKYVKHNLSFDQFFFIIYSSVKKDIS